MVFNFFESEPIISVTPPDIPISTQQCNAELAKINADDTLNFFKKTALLSAKGILCSLNIGTSGTIQAVKQVPISINTATQQISSIGQKGTIGFTGAILGVAGFILLNSFLKGNRRR